MNARAWDISTVWSDLEADDEERLRDLLDSASLCVSLPIPNNEPRDVAVAEAA